MLLNLEDLVRKYKMKVTGVVHAGAHLAEEAAEYFRLFGSIPVWWIEGNADVIPRIQQTLRRYPAQKVIEAVLWGDDDVEMTFNVTNYDGMSSSLLEFGTHPEFSPDTVMVDHRKVTTRKLDSLVVEHGIVGANLLNMDLQGVEFEVALGAWDLLSQIDYINSEVNTDEVYKGCVKIEALDGLFERHGFERVETAMVPGQGWGDALWVRR